MDALLEEADGFGTRLSRQWSDGIDIAAYLPPRVHLSNSPGGSGDSSPEKVDNRKKTPERKDKINEPSTTPEKESSGERTETDPLILKPSSQANLAFASPNEVSPLKINSKPNEAFAIPHETSETPRASLKQSFTEEEKNEESGVKREASTALKSLDTDMQSSRSESPMVEAMLAGGSGGNGDPGFNNQRSDDNGLSAQLAGYGYDKGMAKRIAARLAGHDVGIDGWDDADAEIVEIDSADSSSAISSSSEAEIHREEIHNSDEDKKQVDEEKNNSDEDKKHQEEIEKDPELVRLETPIDVKPNLGRGKVISIIVISILVNMWCSTMYAFPGLFAEFGEHVSNKNVKAKISDIYDFSFLGMGFGFLPGILADRIGPSFTVLIASFILLVGFFGLSLSLQYDSLMLKMDPNYDKMAHVNDSGVTQKALITVFSLLFGNASKGCAIAIMLVIMNVLSDKWAGIWTGILMMLDAWSGVFLLLAFSGYQGLGGTTSRSTTSEGKSDTIKPVDAHAKSGLPATLPATNVIYFFYVAGAFIFALGFTAGLIYWFQYERELRRKKKLEEERKTELEEYLKKMKDEKICDKDENVLEGDCEVLTKGDEKAPLLVKVVSKDIDTPDSSQGEGEDGADFELEEKKVEKWKFLQMIVGTVSVAVIMGLGACWGMLYNKELPGIYTSAKRSKEGTYTLGMLAARRTTEPPLKAISDNLLTLPFYSDTPKKHEDQDYNEGWLLPFNDNRMPIQRGDWFDPKIYFNKEKELAPEQRLQLAVNQIKNELTPCTPHWPERPFPDGEWPKFSKETEEISATSSRKSVSPDDSTKSTKKTTSKASLKALEDKQKTYYKILNAASSLPDSAMAQFVKENPALLEIWPNPRGVKTPGNPTGGVKTAEPYNNDHPFVKRRMSTVEAKAIVRLASEFEYFQVHKYVGDWVILKILKSRLQLPADYDLFGSRTHGVTDIDSKNPDVRTNGMTNADPSDDNVLYYRIQRKFLRGLKLSLLKNVSYKFSRSRTTEPEVRIPSRKLWKTEPSTNEDNAAEIPIVELLDYIPGTVVGQIEALIHVRKPKVRIEDTVQYDPLKIIIDVPAVTEGHAKGSASGTIQHRADDPFIFIDPLRKVMNQSTNKKDEEMRQIEIKQAHAGKKAIGGHQAAGVDHQASNIVTITSETYSRKAVTYVFIISNGIGRFIVGIASSYTAAFCPKSIYYMIGTILCIFAWILVFVNGYPTAMWEVYLYTISIGTGFGFIFTISPIYLKQIGRQNIMGLLFGTVVISLVGCMVLWSSFLSPSYDYSEILNVSHLKHKETLFSPNKTATSLATVEGLDEENDLKMDKNTGNTAVNTMILSGNTAILSAEKMQHRTTCIGRYCYEWGFAYMLGFTFLTLPVTIFIFVMQLIIEKRQSRLAKMKGE